MRTTDQQAVSVQLDRIRRRRIALGISLLLLPLILLLHYYAPVSPGARQAVVLAWVAAYGWLMLRVAWSRCPRCKALFFVGRPFFRVNPLRSRCGNCNSPYCRTS